MISTVSSRVQTILITGASSGFGKLTTQGLLSKGHNVVAAIRGGRERFESVFESELKTFKNQLFFVPLDLENEQSISELPKHLSALPVAAIDVLVNNAGFGALGPVEDFESEQIRKQWQVNYFGLVQLTKQLLPNLRESRGKIINLSSVVGLITLPFYGQYAATKHAVEAYTESLMYEVANFGIQVALVEPGGFRTDFFGRSKEYSAKTLLESSRYFSTFSKFRNVAESREPQLPNPLPVATKIMALIEAKTMKFRNPVGIDAQLATFALAIFPDRVRVGFSKWLFRKYLG